MAAMRRLAPELLITAKTQRWNPEEFLRTLVEAEIAARDASNARTRTIRSPRHSFLIILSQIAMSAGNRR